MHNNDCKSQAGEVGVGDTIIFNRNLLGITAFKEYEVVELVGDYVIVIDDVGERSDFSINDNGLLFTIVSRNNNSMLKLKEIEERLNNFNSELVPKWFEDMNWAIQKIKELQERIDYLESGESYKHNANLLKQKEQENKQYRSALKEVQYLTMGTVIYEEKVVLGLIEELVFDTLSAIKEN